MVSTNFKWVLNDDWGMRNEWKILGKDNSPTLNDKWVFSPNEWLNDYWAIPIVIDWTYYL